MTPKVSIIILNYNKEDFIEEAIKSALNQDYEDFEVFIIDDGSTDNSINLIQRFESHPKVRILLKENEGVIKTRNSAIQQAKGAFIVQLDGDDKLGSEFLKLTVPILEKDNEVGIVYCKTSFIGIKSGVWELGEYSLRKQLTTNQIVITALFRKSDFLKTPGYRKEFSRGLEDWDLWLSIISLGRKVIQLPKVAFYYRILPKSRNTSFSDSVHYELKTQISKFHANLYESEEINVTNLLWDIEVLKEENKWLVKKANSIDYKVGKTLLKIPRLINRIIKKV